MPLARMPNVPTICTAINHTITSTGSLIQELCELSQTPPETHTHALIYSQLDSRSVHIERLYRGLAPYIARLLFSGHRLSTLDIKTIQQVLFRLHQVICGYLAIQQAILLSIPESEHTELSRQTSRLAVVQTDLDVVRGLTQRCLGDCLNGPASPEMHRNDSCQREESTSRTGMSPRTYIGCKYGFATNFHIIVLLTDPKLPLDLYLLVASF
jgi:hypothetical protein